MQKEVVYQSINTYDTLNELTDKTKTVWLVFHGIGYLSRYFIRLFQSLNPEENYIIAPQAPSKYYKNNDYKRVGSSWLTKENTQTETKNVLNYIDAVMEIEKIPSSVKFVVLGYSQGVSIASRWIASRKVQPEGFVMVSGGFPKELQKEHFTFLSATTKITHILGEQDPYFEIEKVNAEKERVKNILPQIEFRTHSGGHELNIDTLENIF
ncbi:alpha/beta hydrolase [Aquimarina litoralis]|uniref:alpha/beta hydrolase n=1 Tax=Aquimarina litoralis TaxID=584605 RepID=UPI001C58279F|nr:dienelactone hydrolase family protein [Aquimarina litoralis]MBW1297234.1 esterase [Aquimarina litoralis]